jgi:hypothetical protein
MNGHGPVFVSFRGVDVAFIYRVSILYWISPVFHAFQIIPSILKLIIIFTFISV